MPLAIASCGLGPNTNEVLQRLPGANHHWLLTEENRISQAKTAQCLTNRAVDWRLQYTNHPHPQLEPLHLQNRALSATGNYNRANAMKKFLRSQCSQLETFRTSLLQVQVQAARFGSLKPKLISLILLIPTSLCLQDDCVLQPGPPSLQYKRQTFLQSSSRACCGLPCTHKKSRCKISRRERLKLIDQSLIQRKPSTIIRPLSICSIRRA
mmetsp:Transcript_11465/g.18800  ORF Transcript_11465/g.18800 Transcript_11465/m.18800 type:complete len:210 (-) Transcript_11465:661-1290(-)